ncbi:MAG TPA: D-alanyl-D-alanine carboxypeptidase/D-alanyl-D-alanine-endopeptidase [Candidatus Tumulicola sp.]|jgi:D-alanyl-D-alanine carboxypeptidase/D-alanyl-D-alanine-endopeptidase (penicillin-binding protein 4)
MAGKRYLMLMATATLAIVAASSPAAALPAEPASAFRDAIDGAIGAPTLTHAHVGLLAIDAVTGNVLYARNADDDFVPASTLKLLVGSAALARLGPAYALTTGVLASGLPALGTLAGDLYLRGGGDAQLADADLDAAAAAVASAGIRRIAGSLVADASRYDAPRYPLGWAIDDVPYGYAAVPSALALDLNVVPVRVLPGSAARAPTTLQAPAPSRTLTVENASITGAPGSADTTDLARPWDRPDTIEVIGSYPLGAPLSDDLSPSVPDPSAYTAEMFERALAVHGVTIGNGVRFGPTPPGASQVWSHHSQPLRTLLRDFWLPSTNLIGEQLLEELGAVVGPTSGTNGSDDTRARGISSEMAWLRSIGGSADAVTIVDGSGLSAYDRVEPRTLATILRADWRGPFRDSVLAALPVAGTSGTLRSTFAQPPLRGAVFAKTGTENHARALAGYVRTRSGGTVIFALMVDDWTDESPQAQTALDAARAAILTALVRR